MVSSSVALSVAFITVTAFYLLLVKFNGKFRIKYEKENGREESIFKFFRRKGIESYK